MALLHPVGYYTLNAIAPGEKLTLAARTPSHNHADMMAMASTKDTPPTNSKGKTGRTTAAAPKMAKRIITMPADWTNGPDQTLTVGTKPGLKFDTDKLEVKAGSRIKLVFNNNDDMLHNFVVTKPGEANSVGEAALKLNLNGPKMNYVPNTPDVLYHTNILQPESAETIYFVAPTTPGNYQFVCSFPGHYSLMQGTLVVK